MLTEAEAKTKWCPFARGSWADESMGTDLIGGINRRPKQNPEGLDSCRCIASACMAWRWERGTGSSLCRTKDEMVRRDDGSVYFKPVPPEGDGWHQQWTDPKHANRRETGFTDWIRSHSTEEFTWGSARLGYCGLSGEPK